MLTDRGRWILALGGGIYLAAWALGSEVLYPVAPLPVPEPDRQHSAADLVRYDSLVLFLAQAGSALDRLGSGRVVAFEADQIDPIAESGWSVLVSGTASHLRDTDRIAALADTAVHPWAPGRRDRWIEIHAEQITGRIIRRHRLVSDAERSPYLPPD